MLNNTNKPISKSLSILLVKYECILLNPNPRYFYVFTEHFEHLIGKFYFYIFTKVIDGIYLHFFDFLKLIFVSDFISHPITISINYLLSID